jgi:serine phosphatase RsbU (regulator of sigma subunit)/pSer/pThr/pTyr-binding forkhead associated (FHA) protein
LDGQEQVLPLGNQEVVLGRGKNSETEIMLDNVYISRRHARVLQTEEGYTVSDLGSAFGTLVNGEPIEGSRVLRNGDRIVMGKDHVTVFFFDGEADFPTAVREARTARLDKSISDLTTHLPTTALSDLEKISFILDFQYQWGQSFTPEKTFQQILESALTISGAERGFILVRKKDRFEYAAGMNRKGRGLAQKEFQGSQSVVAQVVSTGKPEFMAGGIRGKFAEQQSIVAQRLTAVVCLPLYGIPSQGDTPALLGILYLDSTKLMPVLKALDEKLLNKLAEEAGHVLEQVEVLKTLEERRKLEQELSLAQETQRNLLPRSLPEYENFRICALSRPTRHVGGDLYDFATPESGELLGVLADVAGKGLAAALLSSMILGCLDMQLRAGVKPAHALNQLNKYLCEKSASNRFAALFLFLINPAGIGEYISAGQNPAYLFRAGSGEIEELPSTDLLLGAFEFVSYHAAPFALGPGDVLVIYSDGLTEAENDAGEMLGEDRVKEVIRREARSGAAHLEAKLLETIADFTRGHAQTDDITLVIVERMGNP